MLAASVILAIFWGSTLVAAGCQQTSAIESLDLKSLEGRWYQLSSFGTFFIHGLDRCQVTDITAGSDGKSFIMANDRIARLINTHFKYNWNVEAKDSNKLNGDLSFKFKIPLIGSVSMPLKILGTDYKNYLILHVCRELGYIFKFNAGYILTRQRHYPAYELEKVYASIDETLKKNNLPRRKFSLSIQTNCEDKSSSPSNTDSTALSKKPSATGSQVTGSTAPTTGAVEEKKIAASKSETTAEKSDDKTTTKPSQTTTDEKSALVPEKTTTSDPEKATASDTEKATAEKAAAT